MVKVWYFDSTREAHAGQNRVEIKTGDVLVIPRERVVGVAGTWPLALTTASAASLRTAKLCIATLGV